MSAESGASFGSCFTLARRYWSRTFSRHARVQFSGIGPVDACTDGSSRVATTAAATSSTTRATRKIVSPCNWLIRWTAYHEGTNNTKTDHFRSGNAKTYKAFPVAGEWMSGAIVAGTRRGL